MNILIENENIDLTRPLDKMWSEIFVTNNLAELLKMINVVLSIPVSNAFVERLFSIMNNLWTDERNQMSTNLVKAELSCRINYDMSCEEFRQYLAKDEQLKLMNCIMSSEKYS